MERTTYLIALGSNRRHGRYGAPLRVIAAALDALDVTLIAQSPTMASAAIGPSSRSYANAAALIETTMMPDVLLDHLKDIETDFGRRRGQRWGARVIDLDIILWSGGCWEGPGLCVPHTAFRTRDFVLKPLCAIAPGWRDPVTGFSVKQLKARLDRSRPLA